MLTGLRGVGKTVLLHEFGRIARRHKWIHQHIEAAEDTRFPEAIAMLTRRTLLQLSAGQRLADRGRRALGVLRSFQLRWNLPDGGSLDVAIDPVPGRADSGALEDDLADLFLEVAQAAKERQVGVLFTVDEIQYLVREDLAALIVGLHRISQEQLPLMVAGAGLPSLPALAGEAKSYAERLFTFSVIGSLDQSEAKAALATPAGEEGVRWEDEALARVVEETKGYPYFLQEFGKQAWDVAQDGQSIRKDDVEAAIPIAMNELDTGFLGCASIARRMRNARTCGLWPNWVRGRTPLGRWLARWEGRPLRLARSVMRSSSVASAIHPGTASSPSRFPCLTSSCAVGLSEVGPTSRPCALWLPPSLRRARACSR